MPRILFRLLSKRSRLPKDDIITSTHLLCSSAATPWSAVLQRVTPGGEEYSEVAVFAPEEVQLFGALALALPDPGLNGQVGVEPLSHSISIDIPARRLNFRSLEIRQVLMRRASRLLAKLAVCRDEGHCPDYVRTCHALAAPTLELIRSIDIRDRLLIRGLSKFLSARALSHEWWYLEEAGMAAFISLEAALCIIRQHLESKTKRPASFDDAYDYIRATFTGGATLVDWLLDLYDFRTITVHPSSRFGEFWNPPMEADHCLEAIDWLVSIYRHILIGEIPNADAG